MKISVAYRLQGKERPSVTDFGGDMSASYMQKNVPEKIKKR